MSGVLLQHLDEAVVLAGGGRLLRSSPLSLLAAGGLEEVRAVDLGGVEGGEELVGTGGLVGDVDVEWCGLAGTDGAGLSRLQLPHPPRAGRDEAAGAAAVALLRPALVSVVPHCQVGHSALELLHLIGPGERNTPRFFKIFCLRLSIWI